MAEGFSPKLPLQVDESDGAYALSKTYKEVAKQNLKHLILTAPGEHIMDPDLGVGLRRFLFEPNLESVHIEIEQRIKDQVGVYLPYIQVISVTLVHSDDGATLDPTYLGIIIKYI